MPETVLVATCGQGIMWSSNRGERWRRLDLWQDIEYDAIVRSVTAHPTDPSTVFAGYDNGIAVSEDGGVNWRHLKTPMDGWHVWQIAVDRNDPGRIYAGSGAPSRARIMKSMDAGSSWTLLSPEFPEFCKGVHKPRVVTLTLDPLDGKEVWFGVEESGCFRSRDDGESWERVDDPNGGVQNSDIHSIVILEGPPKTHIVVVVNAVHVSRDDGRTWKTFDAREDFGLRYSRIALAQPGSNDVFLGVGDGTPGTTTRLWRSRDLGDSWEPVELNESPNSCAWAFAAHPASPDKLFMGTKFGNLYRSEDGGASWRQESRMFSEITDVAWLPVAAEPPAPARFHQGPEPIEQRMRPAKIKRIAHVALYVRDPEASSAWYQRFFDMRVTARPEMGVFLSFGEQHHDIALIRAEDGAEQGGLGLQHVGLHIEGDIDELRRLYGLLLENEVDIQRIVDHGVGKGIYFHDPDGNRLEFFCEEVGGKEGMALFNKVNAPSTLIELEPIVERPE